MKLSYQGIQDVAAWEQAGVALPKFDWKAMRAETERNPIWVHFGAGNIFRGFIALVQHRLLDQGLVKSGIIAADTFDYDIIDKIYTPFDNMTLMVSLLPDGSLEKDVVASIAQGSRLLEADPALSAREDFPLICDVCRHHHERWDGRGYQIGRAHV